MLSLRVKRILSRPKKAPAMTTYRSFEVSMCGDGITPRILTVSIKPSTTDERVTRNRARNRACRIIWGAECVWESGSIVEHHGQVWALAKGGWKSEATSTITMLVEEV